jgi:hypothetical protein
MGQNSSPLPGHRYGCCAVKRGRPILFLVQVVIGWTMLRLVAAWSPVPGEAPPVNLQPALVAQSTASLPNASPILWPDRDHISTAGPVRLMATAAATAAPVAARQRATLNAAGSGRVGGWSGDVADAVLASGMAFVQTSTGQGRSWSVHHAAGRGQQQVAAFAAQPATTVAQTDQRPDQRSTADRWSGTAWLLVRSAGGANGAPLLGGSQAGARIERAMPAPAVPSLRSYARMSGPIERPVAEVALGLSARPLSRIPVTVALEARQRVAEGGRSGLSAYAAGGFGPRPIGAGIEAEGYAQAGVVGLSGTRSSADGFIDGRVLLARPIPLAPAGRQLRIGMSADASAQRGASRLDVGPQIEMKWPGRDAVLRLSAGWRERVAGDARPGSGPALVLIGTF